MSDKGQWLSKRKLDKENPKRTKAELIKELQSEREKVALLRDVVGDLMHHFNDYGMESEAIACLMAVKKARQTLEKLKEREGKE